MPSVSHIYRFAWSLFLFTTVLVGCGESIVPPPTPEMSGRVELLNEAGRSVSAEDVVVTVRSPLGVISMMTTTEANGAWNILDVPPGRFTVEFAKADFGAVQLTDIPSDTTLGRVTVPEQSSAVVTGVSARVNNECGTSPCLSVTTEVEAATFLPEGSRRRFFRGFLGTPGELSPEAFDQTFWFLVTDDDPNLRFEAGKAIVTVKTLRGLDLDAAGSLDGLALLLVGATENTTVINGEDQPRLSPIYPDIAPQGVRTVVEPAR